MRLPKGFGKNYFTLRAITATVNQITLNANSSRVHTFHMLNFQSDEIDAELEEEELAATLCTPQLSLKPCHCNCYFLRKTRKTLLLHPEQNYFFDYFKTLNNAISPPKKSFSNNLFITHTRSFRLHGGYPKSCKPRFDPSVAESFA